jgi:membrane protein DedA with SNARE-associated domain
MSILPDLHVLFVTYGVWAVFLVVMLESAGLPCPGETTLILAAAYAGTTHNVSIELVVAMAAAGAILGDNFGYWIGRGFGFPLLVRYGRYIHLDESKLKLGEYLFRQHGGKIVFFGRFTPLLRAFAALLAGANRYPSRQFFLFNALGGVAWATIIGFGAYWCGRAIQDVMGPVGFAMLALFALSSVVLWKFFKRHEARLMLEAEAALPGPLAAHLAERAAPVRWRWRRRPAA